MDNPISPKRAKVSTAIKDHGLSNEAVARFSRHLLSPGFGASKQDKLCSRSVLVIGAGGLGSTIIPLLAGSGLKKIGIVDADHIEVSNLHRQVLYREDQAGLPKAAVAAAEARRLNGMTEVVVHEVRFGPENGLALVRGYDLVMDATDNVYSRYLINDACVLAGKPLVSGSAIGFEGQLTVYHHAGGPCYRCVFPRPNPLEAGRSCADSGVLGPVPAAVGCMQVTEAIKVLTGFGEPLSGKLMTYDSSDCSFYTLKLKPASENCAVCSKGRTIRSLADSAALLAAQGLGDGCARGGGGGGPPALPPGHNVSCRDYAETVRATGAPHLLLDVRPQNQFEIAAVEGAVNVPLDELGRRRDEVLRRVGVVPAAAAAILPVYVICRRGNASRRAAAQLLLADEDPSDAEDPGPFAIKVKGLPWAVTEGEVRAFFEGRCGGVVECRLPLDPHGRPAGYAMVSFSTIAERKKAMACTIGPGGRWMTIQAQRRGSEQKPKDQGFGLTKVYNVVGGVTAWAKEVDPEFPLY